ncbi:MAG: hypothetical protein JNL01_09135 [Bdellovibrionales bacterium]|nr:hypothetical protein [Bdellovibrionales bacterium]
MRRSLILAILIGSFGTGILYWADSYRTRSSEREFAYRLSHQVASQAEAFWIAARNEWPDRRVRGVPKDFQEEPVDWVVKKLTQGRDPRIVQVARATDFSTTRDFFEWDPKTGIASLMKPLSTPEKAGVKIRVLIQPAGFLGTRTALTQDLAVIGTFLSLLLWVFAFEFLSLKIRSVRQGQEVVWSPWATQKVEAPKEAAKPFAPAPAPTTKIAGAVSDAYRKQLLGWGQDYRVGLNEAGLSFRNTFQQAGVLAKSAKETQRIVRELKNGISHGAKDLEDSRVSAAKAGMHLSKAEAAALNIYLDLGRGTLVDPRKMESFSKEIHENIREARGLLESQHIAIQRSSTAAQDQEKRLDEVISQFHAAEQAAQIMDREIEAARSALSKQAKVIQEMFREAERAEDARSILNATKSAPRKSA